MLNHTRSCEWEKFSVSFSPIPSPTATVVFLFPSLAVGFSQFLGIASGYVESLTFGKF
jgi:hypothetical protein